MAESSKRKRVWKDSERPERIAKLGLSRGELETLLSFLADGVEKGGCDHTFRLTRSWLSDTGKPASVAAALRDEGGGCDCEVVQHVRTREIFGIEDTPTVRIRPKRAPAAPITLEDEALRLAPPDTPWHAAPPDTGERVHFVLGTGSASLRLLAPPDPLDEPALCRQRGLILTCLPWRAVAEYEGRDPVALAEAEWGEHAISVIGPKAHVVAGRNGRLYRASSQSRTYCFLWWFVDLPKGVRVLELATELPRCDGDLLEMERVVARATVG